VGLTDGSSAVMDVGFSEGSWDGIFDGDRDSTGAVGLFDRSFDVTDVGFSEGSRDGNVDGD